MSLDWYIPYIIHYTKRSGWCKWQWCINSGTLCFRDNSSRGPGVSEHSYKDTSVRDVPSPHLNTDMCRSHDCACMPYPSPNELEKQSMTNISFLTAPPCPWSLVIDVTYYLVSISPSLVSRGWGWDGEDEAGSLRCSSPEQWSCVSDPDPEFLLAGSGTAINISNQDLERIRNDFFSHSKQIFKAITKLIDVENATVCQSVIINYLKCFFLLTRIKT